MALSITITARKLLQRLEAASNAKLNQLGLPTLAISGTASTEQIADGAVTAVKGAYGPWFYCSDATGSANAVVLTLATSATELPTSLVPGQVFRFYCEYTNTSTVTVAVNGIFGTVPLKKQGGIALAAGDLRADQEVEIIYDDAAFQLLSPTGQPAAERFVETGSADGLAYTATFAPTVTALTTGTAVTVKWNITNTGAVTLAANGLTAKAVRKANDAALAAGDILDKQISTLVYDSAANGAGAWLLTGPTVINTPATVTGLTRNLTIANNATDPTFKMDIAADEVVLKNAGGLSYLAEAVAVTANMSGTVGTANALDTGAEAADTWYFLWLIYNGTTVASLLSASSTAPTLPTGYTYKALVGEIYNSGTNFVTSYRTGKDVFLTETTVSAVLDPGAASTYEDLAGADLTAFRAAVPLTAGVVRGTCGLASSSAATETWKIAANTAGVGAQRFVFYRDGTNGGASEAPFEVPQNRAGASRNLAWQSTVNAAGNIIRITGYRT